MSAQLPVQRKGVTCVYHLHQLAPVLEKWEINVQVSVCASH